MQANTFFLTANRIVQVMKLNNLVKCNFLMNDSFVEMKISVNCLQYGITAAVTNVIAISYNHKPSKLIMTDPFNFIL